MFFVSDKTIRYGFEAVQRLHSATMYYLDCDCCDPYEICSYCDELYPCLTITTLEGRQ